MVEKLAVNKLYSYESIHEGFSHCHAVSVPNADSAALVAEVGNEVGFVKWYHSTCASALWESSKSFDLIKAGMALNSCTVWLLILWSVGERE